MPAKTPSRRKSLKAIDLDLDDSFFSPEQDAHTKEQLARERCRRSICANLPQLADKTPISAFSELEKVEHYNYCMRLAADNKINAKNAFQLHLIDYFCETTSQSAETNFQLASMTLQASTKIYSVRVDTLHQNTLKITSAFSVKKNSKGQPEDMMDVANEGDDMNPLPPSMPRSKANRKKKAASYTSENPESLSVPSLSTYEEPHENYDLVISAFKDGSQTQVGLLNSIVPNEDGCFLLLHQRTHYLTDIREAVPTKFLKLSDVMMDTCQSRIIGLEGGEDNILVVGEPFDKFSFNKNEDGSDDVNMDLTPDTAKKFEILQNAFQNCSAMQLSPPRTDRIVQPDGDMDQGDIDGPNPDPFLCEDNDNQEDIPSDVFVAAATAADQGDFCIGEDQEFAVGGSVSADVENTLSELNHNSQYLPPIPCQNKEISMLEWISNPEMQFLELGRRLLKVQPPPKKKIPGTTSKKAKETVIFKFEDEEIEKMNKNFVVGRSIVLSKREKEKWKSHINLNRYGSFDETTLMRPFIRTSQLGIFRNQEQALQCEDINMVPNGDDNLGHNSYVDDVGGCDDYSASTDEPMFDTMTPMTGSQTADLLPVPRKVQKDVISFEKIAKRINQKLVKSVMWNAIKKIESQEKDNVKFSSVYKKVLTEVSTETRGNMTIAIAFVILLQLVNENALQIRRALDVEDIMVRTET